MWGLPRATDERDDRNRVALWIGVVGVCVAFPLLVFVQQFMGSISGERLANPDPDIAQSEVVFDPGVAGLTVTSKMSVKSLEWEPSEARRKARGIDAVHGIDKMVETRTDRLRAAIVAGELESGEEAVRRLAALDTEVNPDGDLSRDVRWLLALYRGGPAGGDKLPQEARESLVSRHGWFGQLALAYGLPDGRPEREEPVGGFERVIVLIISVGIFRIISGLAALVMLIVGLIAFFRGRLTGAFDTPALYGDARSVYVEMVGLFFILLSFSILMTIPFRGAGLEAASIGFVIQEGMMWSALLVPLWPLMRGVRWDSARLDLGLHTGNGVVREVGVGILGWLFSIAATFLVTVVIAVVALVLSGGEREENPGGFPMFQQPLQHAWWAVIIANLGAVLWAPIVEEIVFRGALYRVLHPSLRWFGAGVVSAAVFGAVHPYGLAGCLQVGCGGLIYATLREWRGSLIPSMVAHFLHNGTITLVQLGVLGALG